MRTARVPVGCCLTVSEELVQEAVGAAVDEVPEDQVGVRVTGTVSRPKGGDATQVLLYRGKGARR